MAEQQRLTRVVEEHRLKEHAYLMELGKSRGVMNSKPGLPTCPMTTHLGIMEREALRKKASSAREELQSRTDCFAKDTTSAFGIECELDPSAIAGCQGWVLLCRCEDGADEQAAYWSALGPGSSERLWPVQPGANAIGLAHLRANTVFEVHASLEHVSDAGAGAEGTDNLVHEPSFVGLPRFVPSTVSFETAPEAWQITLQHNSLPQLIPILVEHR
jgi:hypothetical protein